MEIWGRGDRKMVIFNGIFNNKLIEYGRGREPERWMEGETVPIIKIGDRGIH